MARLGLWQWFVIPACEQESIVSKMLLSNGMNDLNGTERIMCVPTPERGNEKYINHHDSRMT